eukprot:TRINITY_DN1259_c0_g1_i1.p1 TRINITY_DN1259_c0_g1~~TRINITY_DN1259_c0_g1_i1.p1  ORF type:complete len:637 (+),score=163.45 TRINITY_DN1259_c0_g1_i1:82-1992(+)
MVIGSRTESISSYFSTDSETSDGEFPSATGDEKAIYNELLKEIPVGWVIVKLMDEQDMMTFVVVTGNPIYESFVKMPLTEVVGKLYTEIHPSLLVDDCHLLKESYLTATSGKTRHVPTVDLSNDIVGKVTVRIKFVALPNHSVLVVFEQLNDPEDTKKKRQDIRAKLEDIMDRFLDTMLNGVQGKEEAIESHILRNVLSFGDLSESDILISDTESLITAADIGTLIQNLAEAKEDFIEQFLITFRYFITPKALLNKLIFKYLHPNVEENAEESRQRLTKVFRTWIKDHYYDFDVDPELLASLNSFISEHALHLKKLLSRQMSLSFPVGTDFNIGLKNRQNSSRILNMFKKKSTLTKFDATVIAHQLTLLCFQRFKNIKPLELHSQSWSKENKNLTSPNVVAMVNHFNVISNLFQYEIVSQQNFKKRIEVLKHIISIGWAAYGYRDYETTFTVVMSLGSGAVSRLAETWKGLTTTSRQQWDAMEEFCHYKENYKTYRSHLRKNVNMVPYMGLFLKDLTIIDENDTITAIGAVNFFKMRKVAHVIGTIQRAQQSIFNFQKDIKLTSYISFEVPLCDENDLWELSLQCERQTDMERSPNQRRLADILAPTPFVMTSSNPIFGMNAPRSPGSERRIPVDK